MNINTSENLPIACDFTAIPASIREQHIAASLQTLQAAQEVQELPDGYTFRFNNEPGTFMALANFVENERLCCPFYHFGIEVEPGGGPLWLRLTGGEGVKEFEEAVFINPREALRQQLIRTDPDGHLDEPIAQAASRLADLLGKASPDTPGTY